jgi:hypothetical protein
LLSLCSNNSNQFFSYISAELNSQWPITESAQIKTKGLRQHGQNKQKQQNKEKLIS